MYCEDKFDCANFMIYHNCQGCTNGGYTQRHYDNDYDFDDEDFIG